MANEDPLWINPSVSIPLAEIDLRTSRSSGPGGQHANVTASRVEAVFDVAASQALTEEQRQRVMARVGPRLTATAQDTRSQARNRTLALERLAERLRAALAVQATRRRTRPSRSAKERRLAGKRRRGDIKRGRGRPSPEDW